MRGLKKYFVKYRDRENIEAEEIFLDAEAIRSIEEKGKLEQPIKSRNFLLFYGLIIFCLIGLFLRAGYLQIVRGDYYQDLAQGNRLRIYSISAPRGIIYDYQGEPLVYNTPSFDLVVNLSDFLDNPIENQEEILNKIAEITIVTSQSLKEKITKAEGQVSQVILFKNIARPAALVLESMINDWPGLRLEKNAQRHYLASPNLSHLIGYTGQISPDQLISRPDYSLTDQIGKDGLECYYEAILRGEPGQEQFEVDSLGKTQRLLATKPVQPGQGLMLHLDQGLQEKLYQSLDQVLKKLRASGEPVRKAAALAINPQNGGIKALVSLPSFDSNLFAQGISQEELAVLENDPNEPFLNRVLAGQYPSGSIIKPLIAAAALEEKIIKPNQTIDCQGGLAIINEYNPEIIYHFPDWKAHGLTDIIKAIAESCNVFFYTISGGYGKIEGLGVDLIKEYLQGFGLGQATGIDLPHEEIGLIPDSTWKETVKQGEPWYLGDTYHLAIGQGDILVTPLQMALAISAIANNGVLYQPQIVDKIIDQDKNLIKDISSQKIRENFIDLSNLKIVQEGMRQAVLTGSARALANLPVAIAGKTGTAQFGNQGKTHAWFVGYAPYQEPEIVIMVLIEAGGGGDQTSVPVAKEVLEWYFNR